jgi:hypothetical protein
MNFPDAPPGDPPPLSPEDERRVWWDWHHGYPPGDPLHWWATRRLAKAGLLDQAAKEEADDALRRRQMRPMRKTIAAGRPPAGEGGGAL